MATAPSRFVAELRSTALRLAAYFGVLAAVGWGAFACLGGELINILALADQQLEWMAPKVPQPADTHHASLKPKLRGRVEE